MEPLIHVAKYQDPEGSLKNRNVFLLLRKRSPHCFVWYKENEEAKEEETEINASTIEEAIRLANRTWKNQGFRTLNCGFCYTLPERDEHGNNALFGQMIASYTSSNGVYFDEERGHHCLVQAASNEAREYFKKLQLQKRIDLFRN
jgi:hypothetical protein